jgi:hypothetical protein
MFIFLPLGHKLMSCKWIFKIKYNVDNCMAMHKICFMTNGFSEVEGIDFNERFFLIAWLKLTKAMFVVATIQDLEVYQMNVKTIFLDGNLSKKIYMQ